MDKRYKITKMTKGMVKGIRNAQHIFKKKYFRMNFEGFQDLMRRICRTWYERAKVEVYFYLPIGCSEELLFGIIIKAYLRSPSSSIYP